MLARPPHRSARAVIAVLAGAAHWSCGARSSIGIDDGAGGATATSSATVSSSATGMPCTSDAACDDGVVCTVDTCTEHGCENIPDDSACEDGVVCTLDSCDPTLGCSNELSSAACDDGLGCTNDACDVDTDTCRNEPCDSFCDDGLFCNGVERCDSGLGCTAGPAACTLGLGCETSSCQETGDICNHSLPAGCAAPDVHLLVTDASGYLFDVAPYQSGSASLIAPPSGSVHLDIAVLNGRWFAIDFALVELAPGTNQVIANLGALDANSLAGGPDGFLYAASSIVFRVDPDSGAQEVVGVLPAGHSSSGDIAFLGDRMFVSTDSGCGGSLVEFDVASGAGAVLGGDGLGCVYGLANVGGELFLVNCDGKVGTFHPDTGEARIFSTTGVLAYGADGLP